MSAPIKIQGDSTCLKKHTKNFLSFLNLMQDQGLLVDQSEGLVLYADD